MTTTVFSPEPTTAADIDSRYGSIPETSIRVGIPETTSSAAGFAVPVITFRFKSPFGFSVSGAPEITIRAPASLSLAHISNYSASGNVFGGTTGFDVANTESGEISFLGQTASSLRDAVIKKIFDSTGNFAGYLQSAGQTGIDQFEFSNRSIINPFQQLLYKGPSFKMYNFPFTLRPKNLEESKSVANLISAFKIAASPKISNGTYTESGAPGSPFTAAADLLDADIPITFGYPDLVDFDIGIYTGSKLTTLYKSLTCAIQSVNTDYGQQKMSFFIPELGSDVFYPTEVTLTLSLQEVVVRSVKNAIEESSSVAQTIR